MTTDTMTGTGRTPGLSVDPEALRAARRRLLRQQEALDPIRLRPPHTGETSHLTTALFAQVETAVAVVAADLEALSGGLDRFLADLDHQDAAVSSQLRTRGAS